MPTCRCSPGFHTEIERSSIPWSPQRNVSAPPTPGETLAVSGNQRASSVASVSARQTTSGGAAMCTTYSAERGVAGDDEGECASIGRIRLVVFRREASHALRQLGREGGLLGRAGEPHIRQRGQRGEALARRVGASAQRGDIADQLGRDRQQIRRRELIFDPRRVRAKGTERGGR